MSLAELLRVVHEYLPRGMRSMREAMRELVRRAGPGFEPPGDDALLEPLLFAWFTAPASGLALEEVLAAPPRARIGVLELITEPHPLLDRFFADERGVAQTYEIRDAARRHARALERALSVFARHAPEILGPILASTRAVLLFHAPTLNSFAAPGAHGIAFLNTALGRDEVFLVEDLAHQGGHVLFHTMTRDGSPFLRVRGATPLRELTGRNGDPRRVIDALHGLFTEALIAIVLAAFEHDPTLETQQRHELQGRLAMILRRYRADLEELAQERLHTEQGIELMRILHDAFVEVAAPRERLVRACDFSNQLYNFDYDRYAALNPMGEVTP